MADVTDGGRRRGGGDSRSGDVEVVEIEGGVAVRSNEACREENGT